MEMKISNLERFKAMQLTPEESKNIISGIDEKPKPTVVIRPGGGTPDNPISCYYTFDDELLYCKDKNGTIVSSTI